MSEHVEDHDLHTHDADRIVFHGLVTRDAKPFVAVSWGHQHGQITPEDAHKLGWRAMSAAIEAERDAGIIAFLRDKAFAAASPDEQDQMIARFLSDLREHRQQYDPDRPKEAGDVE